MRQTHTYAILCVSAAAYDEIAQRLRDASPDYQEQIRNGERLIDMHGLALQREDPAYNSPPPHGVIDDLSVICPDCGAIVQERCFGPDGQTHIEECHPARFERLEELKQLRAAGER